MSVLRSQLGPHTVSPSLVGVAEPGLLKAAICQELSELLLKPYKFENAKGLFF